MHGILLNGREKLFKFRVSKLETTAKISVAEVTAKIASILAIIIDKKVLKTEASFLSFKITDS